MVLVPFIHQPQTQPTMTRPQGGFFYTYGENEMTKTTKTTLTTSTAAIGIAAPAMASCAELTGHDEQAQCAEADSPADASDDACQQPGDFAGSLEREARAFAARSAKACAPKDRARSFIIADFEFGWDHDRHHAYKVSEGEGAETSVRWPFHHVAAASWLKLDYDPASQAVSVTEGRVIALDEMTEAEIVTAFFDVLEAHPAATLVTWGGEYKDIAVLRRSADDFGLMLPPQLLERSPNAQARLDLCNAVSVMATSVHLPEYAAACSIPAKPSPSKSIGKLVQSGRWHQVREQVLADVLTTSIIALRNRVSHREIICDLPEAYAKLSMAGAAAIPGSRFVRFDFDPWVKGQVAAAKLKGRIYRMGEVFSSQARAVGAAR